MTAQNMGSGNEAEAYARSADVPAGAIGIVASGRALAREVELRLAGFGVGISRVLVVPRLGSADGVPMFRAALDMLEADAGTSVMLVMSGAAAAVADEAVAGRAKPVVVGALRTASSSSVELGTKPTALAAVLASGVSKSSLALHSLNLPLIREVRALLAAEQRRAIYCAFSPGVRSEFEAAVSASSLLSSGDAVSGTNGRVIDVRSVDAARASARVAAITDAAREAAADETVGVLVIDVDLQARGALVAEQCVGALAAAKAEAQGYGRHLEVLVYVAGTDLDAPTVSAVEQTFDAAGITLASSATNLAGLTLGFVGAN